MPVRKIAESDYYIRHVCLSAWHNSAPTGRMFMKFFFKRSVEKLLGSIKSDKNNEYFTWRPIYIFYYIMLISY